MSLDDLGLDESFSTQYIASDSWPNPAEKPETVQPSSLDIVDTSRISKRAGVVSKQTTKGSKRYFCTYCPAHLRPGFVRRSDWKKHETLEHEPGKLYVCAHSKDASEPCLKWYYSGKPLRDHHNAVHGVRGCHRNCSAIRESRKVVFACGFKGCDEIFVEDKNNGRDSWYDRCKHVADHFEDDAIVDDWDYSQVIMNLLRQPILCSLWRSAFKECDRDRGITPMRTYRWDPLSTEPLRNLLETTAYKHADMQLDLHQNAIQFIEDLHNHAELPFANVDVDATQLSNYTPLDLASTLDEYFDHKTGAMDQFSLPNEEDLYASSLKPVFDPLFHPSTATPPHALRGGSRKHVKSFTPERANTAELTSSVQRLTAELLRGPGVWYEESF